ncbi:hypothetical protein V8E36_008587 [Tilletia maclaganii]
MSLSRREGSASITAGIEALKSVYARAPTSCNLLLAFLASYTFTTAYADYARFISIGKGGLLPHNAFGWLMSVAMRPLILGRRAMIDPARIPPSKSGGSFLKAGALKARRKGTRPSVYGIAPQRQLTDVSPTQDRYTKELHAFLEQLVASDSSALRIGPSALEGGGVPALFAGPYQAGSKSPLGEHYVAGLPQREFAHIHGHDGSLHLVLSSADARQAMTLGWAQLHALAGAAYRGYWLPGFLRSWGPPPLAENPGKGLGLPPTYTFIYAPRDEDELETVKTLILASARFAAGLDPAKL